MKQNINTAIPVVYQNNDIIIVDCENLYYPQYTGYFVIKKGKGRYLNIKNKIYSKYEIYNEFGIQLNYIKDWKDLIDKSCDLLGVSIEDIRSRNRETEIVDKRTAIVKFVLSYVPTINLSELSRYINRHHATIIYMRDKDINYIPTLKNLLNKLNRVKWDM